jgi:hypothetical protein
MFFFIILFSNIAENSLLHLFYFVKNKRVLAAIFAKSDE